MNFEVIGAFFVAALLWVACRVGTWPLPEWGRRAFWITVVVAVCLPPFMGNRIDANTSIMLMSVISGLAVSEFLISSGYQRWKNYQEKSKLRADEARRTARRSARRAAKEAQNLPPEG